MTRIPAALYRGGTSKGLLFLAEDLPSSTEGVLDQVLLAAMGSPHPRQIDGLGGGESVTSKIALVSKSSRLDADVDYLFAQVNPNSPIVDYASNCGNMLSAVGPFAVEQGLFRASDGITAIRIYSINTDAVVIAELQTPGGEITYQGTAVIDDVGGSGAPVRLDFAKTTGSKTRNLLPTGLAREIIEGIEVTLIDVAVPMMIVPAQAMGKTGYETKAELDADAALIARLQKMRNEAGQRIGLGDTTDLVIPKPVLVATPAKGGVVASRDFVPFNCHPTYSVTGSIALSTACIISGTVAAELAVLPMGTVKKVVIEHPVGKIEVDIEASGIDQENFQLRQASLVRTCRKLFEGWVHIPRSIWTGHGPIC